MLPKLPDGLPDVNERPKDDARARELLAYAPWRLNNLYRVKDKHGRDVPFRLNPQQLEVVLAVYVLGWKRIIILKARQLGFSTLLEIMGLDLILWSKNKQAAIVADTEDNAKKLLSEKVYFAYDRIPAEFKPAFYEVIRNESTIKLSNGGQIYSGVRVRSGTFQFLHVSELGKIAHKDPQKAEEIKTGAIPTVHKGGIIAIESTFEGGKQGMFYDIIKLAMETHESERTQSDFRFFFFPWFDDPSYEEHEPITITDATRRYFAELSTKTGRTFSDAKMRWYQKNAAFYGAAMKKEYPSTPEEAFEVPVEGSLYGDRISEARAKGRIVDFDWDTSLPVHTFWDIGYNDTTAIWFVQFVGREIHFIDFYEAEGEPCAHYARHVLAKPYGAPAVYLPHDAAAAEKGSGLSYHQQLAQAGLTRAQIVPRTPDRWIGINKLRTLLSRAWFHKTNCARGIECLEAYHKRYNERLGVWDAEPVHDWASNAADAARYLAEAMEAGLIRDDNNKDALRARLRELPTTAISSMRRR